MQLKHNSKKGDWKISVPEAGFYAMCNHCILWALFTQPCSKYPLPVINWDIVDYENPLP